MNQSVGYSYSGSVKGITLKKAGYYKLEVWGAGGGCGVGDASPCTYGGYSYGNAYFDKDNVIYVAVGGRGQCYIDETVHSGPFNGGGDAGKGTTGDPGCSGGGATHIASESGELKSLSSQKTSVIIVAGAGGGSGEDGGRWAGHGGGYQGGGNFQNGLGGSQVSGGTGCSSNCDAGTGSFGQGASGDAGGSNAGGGGGGGGWYGGGSYRDWAGTGGSGYLNTSKLISSTYRMYCYSSGDGACYTSSSYYTYGTSSTGAHIANAANTGNGYAKITYLGT